MDTVAEEPDDDNWTCVVRMKGAGLPDLRKVEQHVRGMGVGAWLRGVETTLHGRVVRAGGQLQLRVNETAETVRLVPLQQKIHWNKSRNRARKPTAAERNAFSRLQKQAREGTVIVTGPLSALTEGEPYSLEVRQFRGSGSAADPRQPVDRASR